MTDKSFTRGLKAACLAAALVSTLAPAKAWTQQSGVVTAACQVQGNPARPVLQYTRYRDTAVWMGEHGVGSSATDMGQWGTTYWEGYAETASGRYRVAGENNFLEATPEGGYYTDMVTLQITQTGPDSFTLRDFFNDGPPIPCQITGLS